MGRLLELTPCESFAKDLAGVDGIPSRNKRPCCSYPRLSRTMRSTDPSVDLSSRRQVLIRQAQSGLAAGLLVGSPCKASFIHGDASQSVLTDMAKTIVRQTPPSFLDAVLGSGCMLYRGETVSRPIILSPPPDLLLAGTYSDGDHKDVDSRNGETHEENNPIDDDDDDDDDALIYFRCLERRLAISGSTALPSNGHIGTSKLEDAATWGPVVSVWPFGNELAYVWSEESSAFFPASSCNDSAYVINNRLQTALQKGTEVLFATRDKTNRWSSSFFAVPTKYDDAILGTIARERESVNEWNRS